MQTRPEDIEISADAELQAYQMIGTVDQVAYLGESFEYHVRASGITFVLTAAKKHRYRIGESIRLALDPSRLHIRAA